FSVLLLFYLDLAHRDLHSFPTRRSSDLIGFGGFININAKARKAELYIFIGDKSCWGKGFGRDGYKLLVNYGFSELGLERIYLYQDRKSTRLNSSHVKISYAVFCLKKKKK